MNINPATGITAAEPATSAPSSEQLPLSLSLGWALGTVGSAAFMVGSFLMRRFVTDFERESDYGLSRR